MTVLPPLQHAIGNLIFPAAFLITVVVITLNQGYLPAAPDTLWVIGPSVAVAVTGTLALSYNRSRVFFVVCGLAFSLLMHHQVMVDGLNEFIIVGLVPANILLITIFRERGFFTFTGLMRMALILFEFAIALYWIGLQQPLPNVLLDPLAPPFDLVLSYSPFHQTATLMALFSLLGCIFVMGFDNTPISQGLTTALLGMVIGYGLPVDKAWEIFAMSSSLYLGAAIVRDSYNMAYRDELTGLPHRRALNEQFLALGSRYSLAMLDVDHFKKFNDNHGHDIGDQVLQMVAMKIRQVGGGGKAFRYGGEEFSVVFPRMSKEDAFYYLDEVRKAIQNYEMVVRDKPREEEEIGRIARQHRKRGSFRTAGEKVSVTISIGVADRSTDGPEAEDVLKAADKALYSAKKGGRNKVVVTD
ncbi:MAG: GGDEF domain-containing protein [Gammaproteobacteria bacterium]|nr:GGDEF domain-containing protein [Gammaproteobacteria bacterium]MBT7371273.1 GGDEF domain-containing protein [Gammaproteobacteria bacterium]